MRGWEGESECQLKAKPAPTEPKHRHRPTTRQVRPSTRAGQRASRAPCKRSRRSTIRSTDAAKSRTERERRGISEMMTTRSISPSEKASMRAAPRTAFAPLSPMVGRAPLLRVVNRLQSAIPHLLSFRVSMSGSVALSVGNHWSGPDTEFQYFGAAPYAMGIEIWRAAILKQRSN